MIFIFFWFIRIIFPKYKNYLIKKIIINNLYSRYHFEFFLLSVLADFGFSKESFSSFLFIFLADVFLCDVFGTSSSSSLYFFDNLSFWSSSSDNLFAFLLDFLSFASSSLCFLKDFSFSFSFLFFCIFS